jgi:catechol 2,3-dioxygenase-like lactoylglutathione lyase family enzyme
MIDHLVLEVRDRRSKDFYTAALAPLGFELVMEFGERVGGFARDGKPWFWVRDGKPCGRGSAGDGSDRRLASAIEAGPPVLLYLPSWTGTPETRPRNGKFPGFRSAVMPASVG